MGRTKENESQLGRKEQTIPGDEVDLSSFKTGSGHGSTKLLLEESEETTGAGAGVPHRGKEKWEKETEERIIDEAWSDGGRRVMSSI